MSSHIKRDKDDWAHGNYKERGKEYNLTARGPKEWGKRNHLDPENSADSHPSDNTNKKGFLKRT